MITHLIDKKEQLATKDLNEHYEILKLLGEGTYGKVSKAACKTSKQKLALKILLKSKVAFKDFKREVNYSYFLSAHPNVVKTYAVTFQTDELWVFTQELCCYGDLLEMIKPGYGMGEQPTKIVIKQITDAVSFMHSQRICHRDLKPENILVFDKINFFVKLTDFGLTCKIDTLVRRCSCNTPYTPPEVCEKIRNEGFAAQTSYDVWHIGIMLFYMITGKFPWNEADFSRNKNYASYHQWCIHKSTKIPFGWRKFSDRFIKLLKKLLEPDPLDRCNIEVLRRYMDHHWLNNSHANLMSIELHETIDMEEEIRDKQLKEALRMRIHESGIPTVVTKSAKIANINDWIDKNIFADNKGE